MQRGDVSHMNAALHNLSTLEKPTTPQLLQVGFEGHQGAHGAGEDTGGGHGVRSLCVTCQLREEMLLTRTQHGIPCHVLERSRVAE